MSTPVADRLAQEAQNILEKRIADNQLNLPPPPAVNTAGRRPLIAARPPSPRWRAPPGGGQL
jgi:hypothetical protein